MVYTESRNSNSGLQTVYTDHLESKGLHRVYTEYFGVYTEQYRVYTADAGFTESTADNKGKKLEYLNFS